MATYYGAEYTDAFQDVPSEKIQPPKHKGKKYVEYFSWAVPAAAITLNSVVNLCKIPTGALVLNAVLQFPDQGTTGTAILGWAASADLQSDGSTPVEAADDNGLLTTVDMKAAADTVTMEEQMQGGGSNAGFLKQFSAEVTAQLTISEAFDAGTGTVKGFIEYAMP